MQGTWKVFLLVRDIQGWATMGKMLHHPGDISLTAFRKCSCQRPHLARQIWELSVSLGGLASSKGSLPKNHQRPAVRSWQLPPCVWTAVTPGGENSCLSSKLPCVPMSEKSWWNSTLKTDCKCSTFSHNQPAQPVNCHFCWFQVTEIDFYYLLLSSCMKLTPLRAREGEKGFICFISFLISFSTDSAEWYRRHIWIPTSYEK